MKKPNKILPLNIDPIFMEKYCTCRWARASCPFHASIRTSIYSSSTQTRERK